jgi:RNA:NAD 2'-phosphotransferase (TPT1/KptA family)
VLGTLDGVIVYHGTTIEHKDSIQREGLRPNSYVASTLELAREWARTRGMERGSDGFVIFEVDVPDAAVVQSQSWWWAEGQLLLPFGAPASDVVVIDDADMRAE